MQISTIKYAFFVVVLLLATGVRAGADPVRQDALNWLQTMAFAAHQTDFSGIFVYQYGNYVETSRITHVADRDGEHGKLESLDGTRRIVIRHNGQVWCDMGDGKVEAEPRMGGRDFPSLLPEQISLLRENYLIKPAEEARVAGFHAHAIVFQPMDNLRYTHKMWADSNSGLLLKSEVLDEHGDVIEQYSFVQLTIGGNIDRKWIAATQATAGSRADKIQDASHSRKSHQTEDTLHDANARLAHNNLPKSEATPVVSGWRVDALPAGFKKIAEVRRKLRGKDAPVIQMAFSDGLAGISVFIEKSDDDEDDHSGLSSQGVIQVYSKVADGQLVTVVGEVPPITVMQIADSVRNGGSQ